MLCEGGKKKTKVKKKRREERKCCFSLRSKEALSLSSNLVSETALPYGFFMCVNVSCLFLRREGRRCRHLLLLFLLPALSSSPSLLCRRLPFLPFRKACSRRCCRG